MYSITDRDIREADWYTRKVLGSWGISTSEDDLQIGRLSMCYANQTFDSSRGKLLTYARHYIFRDLFSKYFTHYSGRKPPIRSCIYKNGQKNNNRNIDYMADNDQHIIDKITVKEIINSMPPYIAEVITQNVLYGKEYGDSAEELGVSRACLSKRIHDWKKKNIFRVE